MRRRAIRYKPDPPTETLSAFQVATREMLLRDFTSLIRSYRVAGLSVPMIADTLQHALRTEGYDASVMEKP
jgi:hypothetical protein